MADLDDSWMDEDVGASSVATGSNVPSGKKGPAPAAKKVKLRLTTRKPAYKFEDADDIAILKEVMLQKATKTGSVQKWRTIFDSVQLPVKDYRAIQNRFEKLVSDFRRSEEASRRGYEDDKHLSHHL